MGKATGKQPSIQALVPTDMLIKVRDFANDNRMTVEEAFRALLAYGLDHSEEVSWRWWMPKDTPFENTAPTTTVRSPQLCLPAPARRGKFSPPEDLRDATSN